jgi:GNAT superfamily N-acetyltransferase
MYKYAHPNNPENLAKYTEFFGLTTKDLGLYALVDKKIAGAIWSRDFNADAAPTLSFAILPEFKKTGLGIFMMEQFLQEAGAVYEKLTIDISEKPKALKFYEKFGFTKKADSLLLTKELEKKEVLRPTDGYDPTRWMD